MAVRGGALVPLLRLALSHPVQHGGGSAVVVHAGAQALMPRTSRQRRSRRAGPLLSVRGAASLLKNQPRPEARLIAKAASRDPVSLREAPAPSFGWVAMVVGPPQVVALPPALLGTKSSVARALLVGEVQRGLTSKATTMSSRRQTAMANCGFRLAAMGASHLQVPHE